MKVLTRHYRTPALLGILALAQLAVRPTAAQMAPTPRPDKVSDRALALAAQGKTAEAEKALQEALAQCQQSGAPPTCQALLNYTRAYLAQLRGRNGANEAREFYRKVLAEQPSNGAALNNLALIEESLGNNDEAERRWQDAIRSDTDRAGHYALLLGDHYLRLKNLSAALQSFEQASQAAPEADAPRRRIVEVYRRRRDEAGFDALQPLAEQWERIDPATSRSAYELLLGRWLSVGQESGAADRTLVRWASLLARNDWLDLGSLSALPTTREHPGVRELRGYLQEPLRERQWNWWSEGPERLAVTFDISAATGRRLLRDPEVGGPKKAEQCWQQALRTSPPERLVGLPGALDPYLRVSQELASLYFQHPSLDPGGTLLGEMVQRLYEGKMEAIERGDWRVTQAYHTTLALIYVARGVWQARPGTPDYMSARYQLQAILDDAHRREDREKFFQPLPKIKELLATTFVHLGRKSEAAQVYLEAAAGYLDADATDEALQMLKEHRGLALPSDSAGQLERILNMRASPGSVSPEGLTIEHAPWLFHLSKPIDENFLKRQRFKIWADLARSAGAGTKQLTAALEAYQLVVEQQTPLVGAGDLLRWQRVEAVLLGSVNAQSEPARIATTKSAGLVLPSATSLRLTLAGEDSPAAVIVRKETLVSAQVVRAVGINKMLDVQPYLRLRPEGLHVAPIPAGSDVGPSIDKIKRIPNISVIHSLSAAGPPR